jgi:hypothetical protein
MEIATGSEPNKPTSTASAPGSLARSFSKGNAAPVMGLHQGRGRGMAGKPGIDRLLAARARDKDYGGHGVTRLFPDLYDGTHQCDARYNRAGAALESSIAGG